MSCHIIYNIDINYDMIQYNIIQYNILILWNDTLQYNTI